MPLFGSSYNIMVLHVGVFSRLSYLRVILVKYGYFLCSNPGMDGCTSTVILLVL